ncbi:hypothetical protein CRG98_001180 [Punica granatum]|uniref:RPW8 domain-containing protein n=1 Tax=Punica granatum TaxID=22663 RepID=A0A2I0LCM6_PUNGR|nr:hypothetical protein CRG98_001180 [Punica granatum]
MPSTRLIWEASRPRIAISLKLETSELPLLYNQLRKWVEVDIHGGSTYWRGRLRSSSWGAVGAMTEALKTTALFSSLLRSLKYKLTPIQPMIQQIDEYNNLLDRPAEETEEIIKLMRRGKILVEKCSEISRLRYWKKNRLTKKLNKLDRTAAL